jgi:hypothetical protein
MNSEGILEDQSRPRPDVEDSQIITWYKNMVTGALSFVLVTKPERRAYCHQSIFWTRLCLTLKGKVG